MRRHDQPARQGRHPVGRDGGDGRLGEGVGARQRREEHDAGEFAVAFPFQPEAAQIGLVVADPGQRRCDAKAAPAARTASHAATAAPGRSSARKESRNGAAIASGGRAWTSSLSSPLRMGGGRIMR